MHHKCRPVQHLQNRFTPHGMCWKGKINKRVQFKILHILLPDLASFQNLEALSRYENNKIFDTVLQCADIGFCPVEWTLMKKVYVPTNKKGNYWKAIWGYWEIDVYWECLKTNGLSLLIYFQPWDFQQLVWWPYYRL